MAWVVDAELVAADILKSKCQSGESKERNAKRRKEKKKKREEEEKRRRRGKGVEQNLNRRLTGAFPFSK